MCCGMNEIWSSAYEAYTELAGKIAECFFGHEYALASSQETYERFINNDVVFVILSKLPFQAQIETGPLVSKQFYYISKPLIRNWQKIHKMIETMPIYHDIIEKNYAAYVFGGSLQHLNLDLKKLTFTSLQKRDEELETIKVKSPEKLFAIIYDTSDNKKSISKVILDNQLPDDFWPADKIAESLKYRIVATDVLLRNLSTLRNSAW